MLDVDHQRRLSEHLRTVVEKPLPPDTRSLAGVVMPVDSEEEEGPPTLLAKAG